MKTIVVLGMHRSATSLVAGGLHHFGVPIGDQLVPADSSNPKGHWEDTDFRRLNDEILKSAGGSWSNPPLEISIMAQQKVFEPKIKALIKRKQKEIWGWKDPRTTLTIKLFSPHLPNPHFVCCFRDPIEVAKSLQKRNRFSIEKGLELAETYNNRLINFLREQYI
jgi:hypothetical protein